MPAGLTGYSLSIDNTFIIMVIMSSFHVPKEYQLRALFFGVVFSPTFRGILIVLARDPGGEPEVDNAVLRFARKRIGTANSWDGFKIYVKGSSGWVMTPMFVVMVALGATDVMFALDSIPAVYGLTRESYIVFTANAFALMGMRQLYFLLGGLLDRLVYLSEGLALVMFFLGIKLVFHALRESNVPFINGGEHLPIPKISSPLSLGVIAGTLAVTAIASLYATRPRQPATDLDRI